MKYIIVIIGIQQFMLCREFRYAFYQPRKTVVTMRGANIIDKLPSID